MVFFHGIMIIPFIPDDPSDLTAGNIKKNNSLNSSPKARWKHLMCVALFKWSLFLNESLSNSEMALFFTCLTKVINGSVGLSPKPRLVLFQKQLSLVEEQRSLCSSIMIAFNLNRVIPILEGGHMARNLLKGNDTTHASYQSERCDQPHCV